MEGGTAQAQPASSTGKRQHSSSKQKRKETRQAEHVLTTLNEVPNSLKLITLAMKYVELDELYKKSEASKAALEKQSILLKLEKEQLKTDNGHLLIGRSQLEGLCRELYRLNKIVKDESVARLHEEEVRRKEVTTKFETTLTEVTSMMQENSLKNEQLRGDNLSMAGKMKVLYNEFESRKEEQLRLDKQLDLERQLTEVQMQKAKLESLAERALWDEERCALTDKWKRSEETCTELQLIVEELRKRMETYEERHVGYKSAIDNNSKFFESCKTEIRAMGDKVVLLEKEIIVWKERSQQNALKAMDISLLKQTQDAELASALKRLESLQSLCRQLQGDRSSYLKILQAKGIDPDSKNCLLREEMPLLQKELLLKPIQEQLCLIKLECITQKDEMSLNALQALIEDAKSRDEVNSAINLILGFINYKSATKKVSQLDSVTYTVDNNIADNIENVGNSTSSIS